MDTHHIAMLARTATAQDGSVSIDGFCEAATDLLGVTEASIALVGEDGHLGTLAASTSRATRIDEMQFRFGEGPGLDANRSSAPILEPDLLAATEAWPAFVAAARCEGVAAVFSFPLQIGAVNHSVLNLYRDEPGPLELQARVDAVTVAHLATHLLLEVDGSWESSTLVDRLADVQRHRTEVHQATGMVTAQLRIDPGAALTVLRARAWSLGRPLDVVAAEVVTRRLRFAD